MSGAVSSPAGHGHRPPLRTVQHSFHLLDAISRSTEGSLSARELAEQLGLRKRSCYHLLETLREEGYIVRFEGGRYGFGPKLERLYRRFSNCVGPDPRVLPSFTRLHEQVHWRTSINGWYGSDIIVQRMCSDRDKRELIGIGYRNWPTGRASTKAILAFVSEKQLLHYFASRAHTAATERTITDFELFRSHLLEVVKLGYALDLAETVSGWCGVAAPFFASSGFPIGSFGVAAPLKTFDREQEVLIEAVTHAGAKASRALGYSGPYPPLAASPGARRAVTTVRA